MGNTLRTGFIAIVLAAFLSGCGKRTNNEIPPSLFASYDSTMTHRSDFMQAPYARIDSLRSVADTTWRKDYELAKAFSYLSLDSAMHHFNLAAESAADKGDSATEMLLRIDRSAMLMRMNQDAEAVLIYNTIDPSGFSQSERMRYHFAGMQIGLALVDRSLGHYSSDAFRDATLEHVDSLLAGLPEGQPEYDMALAAKYKLQGNESMQVAPLLNILDNVDAPAAMRSNAAFWLAVYTTRRKGRDSAPVGSLLMRAAMIELKAGNQTGLALAPLGQWFYDTGDRDRGIRAWRVAIERENRSGVSNQWVRNSALADTMFRTFDRSRRNVRNALVALAAAFVLLTVWVVVVYRQHRRQRRLIASLRMRVSELMLKKEDYVGEFLHLLTLYIDRTEEMERLARRKIVTGQTDDLLSSMKSGRFFASQTKIVYNAFDNAFLHVFPGFVKELNMLLLPDRQIELPDSESLTPELRVMAFARMGVDDANKVARFLGLSVNTVYAYRNKMRSRVKNRETFDADFMHIGSGEC